MTWDEVADEQRRAAETLLRRRTGLCPRAICSRAYYAVYALVAARAPSGTIFPNGWGNPSHDQVPGIVANLGVLPPDVRGPVSAAVVRLRGVREDADYRTNAGVGEASARTAMRDCEMVFRALSRR